MVAVVGVNPKLIDYFEAVLTPVLDVHERVIERSAIVANERLAVPQGARSFIYIRRDNIFQKPLELAVVDLDMIERFEPYSEIPLKRSSIADVIAVNKSDRPEAKLTLQAIRSALEASSRDRRRTSTQDASGDPVAAWTVPIIETSALEQWGIEALVDAIVAHRAFLQSGGAWQTLQARHARAELEMWLQRYLMALLSDTLDSAVFDEVLQAVLRRRQDPASAARELLDRFVEELAS